MKDEHIPESDREPGGLPWERRTQDVGVRIVDEVGYSLTLDEEWTVKEERGLTWWGRDLAQRVWSELGFDDDGFEIYRLHVQTDLLRDFEATHENLATLNAFAGLARTSGYLLDEEAGTVRLAASMYAHEETEDSVCRALKLVTAIQAAEAYQTAERLAVATAATAATSAHPRSGVRPDRDEMLDILDLVAGIGQNSSAWEGEEMEWTTEMVRSSAHTVLALGGPTGLNAEIPFQSRTSLLVVSTDEPNPCLGNGVLLVLHLPMNIDETHGLRLASELFRREQASLTRAHLLGGWCWRDNGLHFVSFLPNLLQSGWGDLLNYIGAMYGRAAWVAETFYGDDWSANRDANGRPLATSAALESLTNFADGMDAEEDFSP